MVHYGDVTAAQAAAANRVPLPTSVVEPPVAGDQISDYYVQEVQTELLSPGSPLGGTYDQRYEALFEGGLKIYTNLDPTLQAMAEQTIASDTPANSQGFQQAMVTIDPSTGKVLAMVGGAGVQELPLRHHHPGHPPARFGLQALHPAGRPPAGLLDLRHPRRPVALRHRFPHRPRPASTTPPTTTRATAGASSPC